MEFNKEIIISSDALKKFLQIITVAFIVSTIIIFAHFATSSDASSTERSYYFLYLSLIFLILSFLNIRYKYSMLGFVCVLFLVFSVILQRMAAVQW
jgi:uncharacterized membrane protein YoaK (UPF0700 family)